MIVLFCICMIQGAVQQFKIIGIIRANGELNPKKRMC